MGWGPAQIGTALAAGNLAQVVAQTPVGALIDKLRQKRALLSVGIVMIACACLATVWLTSLPVVTAAQALVGVAGAIFPPCLAAITLGLVGRSRMDRQMGTNQAFNAGGNMFAALVLGAIGYYLGMKWMFYLVGVLCVAELVYVSRIKADDIDYDLARGADCESNQQKKEEAGGGVWDSIKGLLKGFAELFKQRTVLVFMTSAVIFHFANAAMVPLVTQMLAKGVGAKEAILYTSGYMLASQLVFLVVAAVSGRLASTLGRKPLFLFAFAALAVRGVLYTVTVRGPVIDRVDLSLSASVSAGSSDTFDSLLELSWNEAIVRLEKALLARALRAANGNRAEAARRLDIHRQLLYAKLKEHGMGEDAPKSEKQIP